MQPRDVQQKKAARLAISCPRCRASFKAPISRLRPPAELSCPRCGNRIVLSSPSLSSTI